MSHTGLLLKPYISSHRSVTISLHELLQPGAGAREGGLCERPAGAAPRAHTGLLLNPYMSSSSLELEPEEEVYVRDLLEQHLELIQVWLILSSVCSKVTQVCYSR